MTISLQQKNDVAEIIMGDTFDFHQVADFRQAYEGIRFNHGRVTVVVNFRQTRYMDSSALGMLINMQKSLSHRNCLFRLVHCNPQIRKVLEIAHFDKKFDIQ